MSISQCKSFCKTHFKEMCTNLIGRTKMKKIARYCQECSVWFWKKFLPSIYCPCCHKKLREELGNLTNKIKRKYKLSEASLLKQRLYCREYRKTHRKKINTYQRKWYKERLLSTN